MPKTKDTTGDQTSFAAPAAETPGNGNGTTKPPKPVELHSAHDFALTRQALTTHADDLEKLVDKVKDQGYSREARTIAADVGAIREVILPKFSAQQELALVSGAALEKQVADALRVEIYRTFNGLDDPKAKITQAGMVGRRDRLLQLLASRVASFARDVAEAAYDQGYQVRKSSPESIAAKAVATLSGGSTA